MHIDPCNKILMMLKKLKTTPFTDSSKYSKSRFSLNIGLNLPDKSFLKTSHLWKRIPSRHFFHPCIEILLFRRIQRKQQNTLTYFDNQTHFSPQKKNFNSNIKLSSKNCPPVRKDSIQKSCFLILASKS